MLENISTQVNSSENSKLSKANSKLSLNGINGLIKHLDSWKRNLKNFPIELERVWSHKVKHVQDCATFFPLVISYLYIR